jgi:hypothetical protein
MTVDEKLAWIVLLSLALAFIVPCFFYMLRKTN